MSQPVHIYRTAQFTHGEMTSTVHSYLCPYCARDNGTTKLGEQKCGYCFVNLDVQDKPQEKPDDSGMVRPASDGAG